MSRTKSTKLEIIKLFMIPSDLRQIADKMERFEKSVKNNERLIGDDCTISHWIINDTLQIQFVWDQLKAESK